MLSSRASHALARLQSRSTVCGETDSATAVSSTLRPPKKRNSTTRAFRGSRRASSCSASSRATTSALRSGRAKTALIERDGADSATALAISAAPSMINQHAPHDLCGEGEEMCAVVKIHAGIDKPEERLIHQGIRLQRMAAALLSHIVPRRPAELVYRATANSSPAWRSPRFHSCSRRVTSGPARDSIVPDKYVTAPLEDSPLFPAMYVQRAEMSTTHRTDRSLVAARMQSQPCRTVFQSFDPDPAGFAGRRRGANGGETRRDRLSAGAPRALNRSVLRSDVWRSIYAIHTSACCLCAAAGVPANAEWEVWFREGRQLAVEGNLTKARSLLSAALRDVERRALAGEHIAATLFELGIVSLDLGRNVEARQ